MTIESGCFLLHSYHGYLISQVAQSLTWPEVEYTLQQK